MELILIFIILWLLSAMIGGLGCMLGCRNIGLIHPAAPGFYWLLAILCLCPVLNTFWAFGVVVMLSIGE